MMKKENQGWEKKKKKGTKDFLIVLVLVDLVFCFAFFLVSASRNTAHQFC